MSPFYKDTNHVGPGLTRLHYDLILIISATILFPNKGLHPKGLGVRPSTCKFWGGHSSTHNSNPRAPKGLLLVIRASHRLREARLRATWALGTGQPEEGPDGGSAGTSVHGKPAAGHGSVALVPHPSPPTPLLKPETGDGLRPSLSLSPQI